MPKKNFDTATNIKYYRELNGLTQGELADHIWSSSEAIKLWEQDVFTPPMGMIERMAKLFNISLEQLLYERSEN